MKTSRKLLVVVLALVMILACTIPAMALNTSYAATYTQVCAYDHIADPDDPTDVGVPEVPSAGIDITLNIVSHKIGTQRISRNNISIHMYQSDCTAYVINHNGIDETHYVCYVHDVLDKADDASWLSFLNSSHDVVTGDYLVYYGVNDSSVGTTIFERLADYHNGRNGWMFRVSGMYPLLHSSDYPSGYNISTHGVLGATAEQAYLEDGDSIDLYFADAYNDTYATRTLIPLGYNNNSTYLGVILYASSSYYTGIYDKWMISDYTQLTSCNKTIKAKINNRIVSGTFNNDGVLVFNISNCSLSSGNTYTVEIQPTYNTVTIDSIDYSIPYTTGCSFSFMY